MLKAAMLQESDSALDNAMQSEASKAGSDAAEEYRGV